MVATWSSVSSPWEVPKGHRRRIYVARCCSKQCHHSGAEVKGGLYTSEGKGGLCTFEGFRLWWRRRLWADCESCLCCEEERDVDRALRLFV